MLREPAPPTMVVAVVAVAEEEEVVVEVERASVRREAIN
jgi:hypothetical protein